MNSPIAGTIVVEESPARLRGLMSGILQIAYPLGWALAALLVTPVYAAFGWRHIFFIALIGLPFAWIIARYLRETPAWQAAAKERAVRRESAVGLRDLFAPQYRYRTLMLLLGQFLMVFAYGATILLTAYFREARSWSAADAIQIVGLSYAVGAFGYVAAAIVGEFFMNRRNVIVLFVCIELMLNAVNLSFVALAQLHGTSGQVMVFFVMTVAAAEAAVGLAIILAIFRHHRTVDLQNINLLRG